uniref:Uncharacterized protein n=1 Tax=Anguilla anguilla TaxID=7936 RepID=A0A0E9THI8_ANGAN
MTPRGFPTVRGGAVVTWGLELQPLTQPDRA